MSDVALIKSALEFARFSSPEVREKLTAFVNALDADLDELAYDPNVLVMNTVEELNNAITEAEDEEAKGDDPSKVVETEIDDIDDDDIDEDTPDPTAIVEIIEEDDDLED